MKIVYCIAGIYRSGGMERVLANKANYLAAHGYEVIIVTTDQCGRKPFFPLDERIKCFDLAINYEENNGKSLMNKLLKYPFKQYMHKKRLSALLKRECPDITVSMFCNEASFITDIKDGSAKILEIHFSRFKRLQYGRTGLWKWVDAYRSKLDGKLVRKFSRFVVLTHEDATYWGNLTNLRVIYNASSFQTEERSSLENKKVIAIGRYTYQKGFDMLVKSWQLVVKELPDWKLYIIGDGDWCERKNLNKQIQEAHLEENIYLLPPTSEISEVYKSASLVAMSSRYEGLPMILVEAQSFGLPIVSFQCKCGPNDIVTDGVDGYLVDVGDVEALAQRIITLAKDEPLRKAMGKQAKLNSVRFEEEKIMQQWMQLFRQAYEDNCSIGC